jgi:hypothetical protein
MEGVYFSQINCCCHFPIHLSLFLTQLYLYISFLHIILVSRNLSLIWYRRFTKYRYISRVIAW